MDTNKEEESFEKTDSQNQDQPQIKNQENNQNLLENKHINRKYNFKKNLRLQHKQSKYNDESINKNNILNDNNINCLSEELQKEFLQKQQSLSRQQPLQQQQSEQQQQFQITCFKAGHKGQEIKYVCLNQDCKKNAICNKCILEKHTNHHCINIDEFLDSMEKFSNCNQEYINLEDQIFNFMQRRQSSLQQIIESSQKIYEEINVSTIQFFSELQNKLPKSIVFSLKNEFLHNQLKNSNKQEDSKKQLHNFNKLLKQLFPSQIKSNKQQQQQLENKNIVSAETNHERKQQIMEIEYKKPCYNPIQTLENVQDLNYLKNTIINQMNWITENEEEKETELNNFLQNQIITFRQKLVQFTQMIQDKQFKVYPYDNKFHFLNIGKINNNNSAGAGAVGNSNKDPSSKNSKKNLPETEYKQQVEKKSKNHNKNEKQSKQQLQLQQQSSQQLQQIMQQKSLENLKEEKDIKEETIQDSQLIEKEFKVEEETLNEENFKEKQININEKDSKQDSKNSKISLENGIKLYRAGNYIECLKILELYQQSVKNSQKKGIENQKAKLFYMMGCAYQKLQNMPDAVYYFKQTLQKNKKLYGKEHRYTAQTHHMLGNCYKKMNNFKEALDYYKKSLSIRQTIYGTEHKELAQSYFYIGKVLSKKGEEKDAIQYHQKSLELQIKILGEKSVEAAESYFWLGIDNFDLQKNEIALKHFKKALEIRQQVNFNDKKSIA